MESAETWRRGATGLVLAAIVTATSVGGCTVHGDGDDPAESFDWHASGAEFGAYLVKRDHHSGGSESTKEKLRAKCARMASAIGTDKAEAQAQRLTSEEVDLAPVRGADRQLFVTGCTKSVNAESGG